MSDRTHEVVIWIKKSQHEAMQVSGLIWCPKCGAIKIFTGLAGDTSFNFCCDGLMYSYEDIQSMLLTGKAVLLVETGIMRGERKKIYTPHRGGVPVRPN